MPLLDPTPDMRQGEQAKDGSGGNDIDPHKIAPNLPDYRAQNGEVYNTSLSSANTDFNIPLGSSKNRLVS